MPTKHPQHSSQSDDVFPGWPFFAEDECEAAAVVLRSGKVNYWTGTEGGLLEMEFAQAVGCKYAVAVANGTVALELALRGLAIGVGDEVIVPSRTFVGTASAVVAAGARPVFADVDRDGQCISRESIALLISPRTKGIVVVHLGGYPSEMDPILKLAKSIGIHVIEDCAQAQGACYKGRQVGSFGQVAAFSFCQDKIMTTGGEGGMVTTNDKAVWQRMWSYKDHGKSFEAHSSRTSTAGFRWLHDSFGTNWRLTEVQSAIGRLQLRKVPGWLAARREHANSLRKALGSFRALRLPSVKTSYDPAWYRFYAFVRPEMLRQGWGRDRIAEAIRGEGVPCDTGSCSEIYLEKAFPAEWRPAERLPVARELGETSLAFLVHPTLEPCHIEKTYRVVEKIMKLATLDSLHVAGGAHETAPTIAP